MPGDVMTLQSGAGISGWFDATMSMSSFDVRNTEYDAKFLWIAASTLTHQRVVDLVQMQPLAEDAVRREVAAHAMIELVGEEPGHAAHPRIARLRNDDVVLARIGGEERLRVVDDEARPLVIEHAAVRRIEHARAGDHLRLDLDRHGLLQRRASEQKVRRHARALADDRRELRVRHVRERDDRDEHLRRDVAVEHAALRGVACGEPRAIHRCIGLSVRGDPHEAVGKLPPHGHRRRATIAIEHDLAPGGARQAAVAIHAARERRRGRSD